MLHLTLVLLYHRSSLSVVTLWQFLKELCLFLNSEYRKYAVFRTFLLNVLTYWAESLHMTLFQCTTDQVWVMSLCVYFWRSYASFWNLNIGNMQFLFARLQTGRIMAWLCPSDRPSWSPSDSFLLSGSPFARFPHFSPNCFKILSWNFAYHFVVINNRSSLSVVTLRQFLKELCLFINLKYIEKCLHLFPTCFDILSCSFAHECVLMYYRSSRSVIHFRQFWISYASVGT